MRSNRIGGAIFQIYYVLMYAFTVPALENTQK